MDDQFPSREPVGRGDGLFAADCRHERAAVERLRSIQAISTGVAERANPRCRTPQGQSRSAVQRPNRTVEQTPG